MKLGLSHSLFVLCFLLGCGQNPQTTDSIAKADEHPSPSAPAEKKTSPTQLKIATYNILWRNLDLPALVETIRKADADLVCLQETTKDAEEYIAKNLGEAYPQIRFHGHRGKHLAERFGFLSRLPIDKFEFVPPSEGMFGFFTAEIQFDGRPVQVATVHLHPVIMSNNAGYREFFAALKATEKTHAGEVAALVKHLKKDVPTLVIGDFNSVTAFQTPKIMAAHGFVDSFAETRDNPEAFPTWRGPMKNGEVEFRIDYLFHSPDFRAVETGMVKSNASDHSLIHARLQWVEKPAKSK
jgi:endonuclease/exonuclease/phosphatase family metal-dependent hydrolase